MAKNEKKLYGGLRPSPEWLKWLMPILAVTWCIVIWQFSLTPADGSSMTSGQVRAFLNGILRSLGIGFELSATMVRKTAHFTEFFVLGALTFWAFFVHRFPRIFPASVGVCVLVAISDECIQYFVPGRAMRFFDMCIDSAGSLCGVLCMAGLFLLYMYIKKRRKNS